jgi:pyruvate/2-oxoglutarate dehydrogenase complex dihydrolipoamide dehydrogenase (E3) component
MTAFDAIVIGAGQAGPYVAKRFAKSGMRAALVERSLFGGTCVNTGCIPTKAMVASAYAARVARRASEYGVVAGEVSVDMVRVKSRKDAIVAKNRDGVEGGLGKAGVAVYRGHARFESPRTVRVGDDLLESDRIFVNVGGRATVPAMPGLDTIRYWTNSSIMDVDFLPRHLVVVGGSYIGLEFAQMYRRFGSHVTVLEMAPRLVPREDEDVSSEIRKILESEGIDVRTGSKCIGFRREGDEIFANAQCEGSPVPPPIAGSHLLLAVGRRPNTDDLGLEKAGVSVDEKGYIRVDDTLATNVPGIWALGDCNGRGAFTHTAYNDGEIVAANLLDGDRRRVSDRITTYALFTDPPLGRAGMTDDEVKRSGRRVLAGKRAMKDVGRAVEKGETAGFMKIAVDADSKEILGAAILGTGGDEVIHSILDVMYAKAPYTTIQRAMHIHPTVAELVPTMLGALKPLG